MRERVTSMAQARYRRPAAAASSVHPVRMRAVVLVEAGVVVATVLSIGILALMLAAPFLPRPSTDGPQAARSPAVSATAAPVLPPIGTFVSREPLSLGPCFAIKLGPEAYPVADDAAPGVASVLSWERGMTGCESRSTQVARVEAHVSRLPGNDPDAEAGYSLVFTLPGMPGTIEVALLPTDSSQPTLLQALDLTTSGSGLVLDRVDEVEPTLNPLPSG